MAGVIIPPASLLKRIAEIAEIPLNAGVFKKDCTDLTRRVSLLMHLIEEIKDSNQIDSAASSSSENDWWSDLVVALEASKRLLSSAARFQARDSSVSKIVRRNYRFSIG